MKELIILINILILCFTACACSEPNTTLKTSFFAMDTVIEITATGKNAKAALESAQAEVERIEKLLSATDTQSEIAMINQSAGEFVEVSAETAQLIQTAKTYSSQVNGAFDVTIYPIVSLWGFNDKNYTVPSQQQIQDTLEYVDFNKIEVIQNTVKIESGMSIDLGAIGKGYCSKKVSHLLKQYDIESAVIYLGGNVQVIGGRSKTEPFRIGIQDPYNQSDILGRLFKSDICVITSGSYQRNFTQDGKLYHHIFDPETGYPADNGLISVSVVCDDPVMGDALSTSFFVLGIDKSIEFLSSNKEISAIFVTENELYISSSLKDCFELDDEHTNYRVNYI